jgi:hypothetical protein
VSIRVFHKTLASARLQVIDSIWPSSRGLSHQKTLVY